jgi:hypothetical protein
VTAKAQFPLSVVIGAVDKVTAPILRIRRSLQRVFHPVQKLGKSFRGLVQATGLDKVAGQLGTIAKKTRGVVGEVGNLTRRLGFMTVAAAAAFGALLYSFTSTGDRILATSQKLGVGVEWLQEMEYAAERTGTSIEVLQGSMGKLSRNIAEAAAGQGASRVAFDALGVSVQDQAGNIRKVDAVFDDVVRSLARLESQELKNAMAARIFGRAGVELMPFLGQGADEIEKLRARARELGIVMSADAVAGAETLGDSMADLKSAGAGLGRTFLTALAPALTVLANKLTEIVVGWGPKVKAWSENFAAKLPERLTQLRLKFESIRDAVKKFFAPFKKLIDRFGAGNVAIAAAALILGGPLLMALGGLAVAIAALASPALLIAVAIGVVIFALYKLGKVVWAVVGPFVKPFLSAFGAIARLAWSLVKLFVTIIAAIAKPFIWLGSLIIKVVGGALHYLLMPFMGLLKVGQQVVEGIAGFFTWLVDKVTAGLTSLINWVPNWIRNLFSGKETKIEIEGVSPEDAAAERKARNLKIGQVYGQSMGGHMFMPPKATASTQTNNARVELTVRAPKGTVRADVKADRGMDVDFKLGAANATFG